MDVYTFSCVLSLLSWRGLFQDPLFLHLPMPTFQSHPSEHVRMVNGVLLPIEGRLLKAENILDWTPLLLSDLQQKRPSMTRSGTWFSRDCVDKKGQESALVDLRV